MRLLPVFIYIPFLLGICMLMNKTLSQPFSISLACITTGTIMGFILCVMIKKERSYKSATNEVSEAAHTNNTIPCKPLIIPTVSIVDYEPQETKPDPERTNILHNYIEYEKLCTDSLSSSIIEYLRKTTDPISNDLLSIQETVNTFLTKSNSNATKNTTEDIFPWAIKQTNSIEEGLNNVAINSSIHNEHIEKEFIAFKSIIHRIVDNTRKIDEISDRVKLLSINASIESARAGTAGKGFKVIASQIKSLSDETRKFSQEIHKTINDSSVVLTSAEDQLQKQQTKIENLLTSQKDYFNNFSTSFQNHLQYLENLYTNTIVFIGDLSGKIHKLSPIIQLHEIIIQEIENLRKLQSEFLVEYKNLLPAATEKKIIDEKTQSKLIDLVRSKLTTSRELDALDAVLKNLDWSTELNLKRNNTKIELF